MSTIYINTPFAKEEHDAIAALARAEGRSKGQQLRALALAGLAAAGFAKSTPKPRRRKEDTKT